MNIITAQKRRVQAAIRSAEVKRADLAREAGLRRSVLTGVLDDSWNPSSETLAKLVDALDRLVFFLPEPKVEATKTRSRRVKD